MEGPGMYSPAFLPQGRPQWWLKGPGEGRVYQNRGWKGFLQEVVPGLKPDSKKSQCTPCELWILRRSAEQAQLPRITAEPEAGDLGLSPDYGSAGMEADGHRAGK